MDKEIFPMVVQAVVDEGEGELLCVCYTDGLMWKWSCRILSKGVSTVFYLCRTFGPLSHTAGYIWKGKKDVPYQSQRDTVAGTICLQEFVVIHTLPGLSYRTEIKNQYKLAIGSYSLQYADNYHWITFNWRKVKNVMIHRQVLPL